MRAIMDMKAMIIWKKSINMNSNNAIANKEGGTPPSLSIIIMLLQYPGLVISTIKQYATNNNRSTIGQWQGI